MKFWTKSLMSRLVIYFLLLSMVTVLGVAAVAFQSAKTSMQQLIFEQLEVTATLKEKSLNLWVENQKNATFSLAQLPDIKTATKILVTDDPSSQLWQDAHTQIRQYMASVLATKPDFQEVQILRATGGQIVFLLIPNPKVNIGIKKNIFNLVFTRLLFKIFIFHLLQIN